MKVTADNGVTTYGDGGNYSATVTAGTAFGGGRGHVLFNADVAHQDGIFSVDRDWNATGYVRITNPAYVAGSPGAPQYLTTLRQVGASNSTPGGLITGSAGGVANRLRGIYFGQGGSLNQFNFGNYTFPAVTGASGPSLTQGGDWQVNDSGRRIGLMPEDSRYGFYSRLSYDVASHVEVFAEGSYNREKSVFNAGPNLSTGITYKPDNAYLIQALGAARLAGITSVTVATTAADLPYRGVNNERKVQRYLIGADGTFQAFGKAAHWDVYGQYGRTDITEQLTNIMNTQNMLNATDAVFAPAGNALGVAAGTIVCRSTLTAPTNGCIPLNRLGIGVANTAAFAYVLGNPERDEVAEQKVGGANLALTPFATWAGDVSVAIGGEWREESIRGYVPAQYQPIINRDANGVAISTTNTWSVGNYLPTNGRYNVKEAYLETVVPLGLGVEFNGAVRATDYSTSGYVTTWKVGGTWQPIRDIRFRATRSRDIRAPNLSDLYQAGGSNSDSVTNPFYSATDASKGPATYGYSATVIGNPNLKPEKSDSLNMGGGVHATLPARLQRVGRLLPDRGQERDRVVRRAGHHQPVPKRQSGFLRVLYGRSDQRQQAAVPQPAAQFLPATGARHRFRGGVSRALGWPEHAYPARHGDALPRQSPVHGHRRRGHRQQCRRERQPGWDTELDLPCQHDPGFADHIDHGRRAWGQFGHLFGNGHRMHDDLPDLDHDLPDL